LHDDGIVAHSTYRNPFRPWGSSGISEILSSFIDRMKQIACQEMGRSQSDELPDEHLKNRVLAFPSVISMVVGPTTFSLKPFLLEKGRQRFANDSVI
jgi:hypothetical protein